MRAAAIALSAAIIAGVYILFRVAPSLRTGLRDGPAGEVEQMRVGLAGWLLGLRWLAVLMIVPVVTIATLEPGRLPVAAAFPLWAGVAALLIFNVAWTLAGPSRLATRRGFTLHIAFDAAFLVWTLHHSGGVANPFAGLFVLHAVITAIVLESRTARAVGGGLAGIVAIQTVVEATGLMRPVPLGAETEPLDLAASGFGVLVSMIGCALIVSTLVRSFREERGKLRSILECMADAVVYVSPDGAVQLRNRAAAQLWAGRPAARDLRVCHATDVWERLLVKLANPGAHELHPVLEVGGRQHEASYARVRDEDGRLLGVVMVARDVTERLELQRTQLQEERLAVVGKLAAGLAHEINNPLGAIALYAQHAIRGVDPSSPLAEHLQVVLRNTHQCTRIVRDLLGYARSRPARRIPLDARRLVREIEDVARTLEPQAERSGVRMVVDEARPEGTVVADPDQLRQVLLNLALNAIEAMPAGGEVRVRVGRTPEGMAIEVSDDGPGMAPAELERIFSAFYTTKAEGTGLGLAVARDIVQAHRGDLSVRSEPGRGTTFQVCLPDMAPDLARREESAA